MDNLICLDDIKLRNNLDIDKNVDFLENRNRAEFINVVDKVIDSGTNYVIKALPINESLKDIALDIKKAFKTKDFKQIIKVAVNSTIREGLEFLKFPKTVISDITKISSIAFKGGLQKALITGVDIVTNKYLKNNIFSPIIDKFLGDIKNYINSKEFKVKVDSNIDKLLEKKEKFNSLCEQWYNLYEKFDLLGMNNICKNIKRMQPHIVNDKDCIKQTNIIENMTRLINSKHDRLSRTEMKVCNTI